MKKILSLVLSVFMLAAVIFPVSYSQADATPKKKKTATQAYKGWLYEADCLGFRLLDINKDGTKELLTTYDGYGKNVYSVNVYTFKGGKVVNCNNYAEEYSMFGFQYNKKTKRLHGSGGGGGSTELWYYTLTKSKQLKKVALQKIENGYNYSTGKMTYSYYFNNKKITKKQYNKKVNKWNKQRISFKLYKMTVRNIKKYVK